MPLTKINLEKVSRSTTVVLRILLLQYPLRTVYGFCFGIVAYYSFKFFEPSLNQYEHINASIVDIYFTTIFGIIIMHIPSIRHHFFLSPKVDEDVQKTMDLIDQLSDTGKITEYQKGRLYQQLITDYYNSRTKKQEFEKRVDEITKGLESE